MMNSILQFVLVSSLRTVNLRTYNVFGTDLFISTVYIVYFILVCSLKHKPDFIRIKIYFIVTNFTDVGTEYFFTSFIPRITPYILIM